jgi:sulfotransferase
MTIHVMSGLPRSGTTLLGNILAQHPDVHVSGTSALYDCVEQVVGALSKSDEVKGDLANVPGSYERYLTALRAFINGWYHDRPEPHIVDKSRGWLMQPLLLAQLDPHAAMIVCVRDPRDVVASIERQHRATALFHSPLTRTLAETTQMLMEPRGMVGGAIRFIEDLLRRNIPVVWVRYETLCASPEATLARLHKAMGVDPFDHDFDNIVNVATDLDAVHYNKFPHVGSGSLKPPEQTWQTVIPAELAHRIAISYPLYMQTFGYD